jgi:probable O-glycosylation ligase (exosortase A-associated)
MRDLLLLAILTGVSLPALIHPWMGALLWTWVSIMNPHRLTWSAYDWPVGLISAAVTLIGLVLTTDKRRLPLTPLTLLLLAFLSWMTITTIFSLKPDAAWPLFDRVWKILLMLLVTIALLHTRRHIEWFVAVIAASLAFFGLKGGIFTLTTGGEFRVWGPTGTFIADNNELALALVMTIPLLRYFQLRASRPWQRWAMLMVMGCCVLAVLGSQSRGAALAGGAMALFLWMRSGFKLLPGLAMVVVAAGAIAFMPNTWETRISTIKTYELDQSVQGRFTAWQTATNVAAARLTGGGFGMWSRDVFAAYNPEARSVHAAHSIYFQVLGEHGAVGLMLFLSIWLVTWVGASRLIRQARHDAQTKWIADLAAMVQVSLVAYAVGGSFYSLAYFDLPYDLAAIVVLCRQYLLLRSREQQPAMSALAPA